jgi:hypothetical protein
MKWSTRGVAAMLFDGPLQLLVSRQLRDAYFAHGVAPNCGHGSPYSPDETIT